MKELVIVAAPTCSGKTRFLDWLLNGRVDIPLSESGYFVESRWSFEDPVAERVILHYALPIAPLASGEFRSIEDDPRLRLKADRVIAITLLVRPEVHAERFRLRSRSSVRDLSKGWSRFLATRKRLKLMRQLCSMSDNVTRAYEAWFEYIDSRADEHYIVTANDHYEVMERSHWPRLRQEYWAA